MSVISGIFQSEATKSAADTAAGASKDASETQLQMFREQQTAMEPWRASGVNALNQLNAMMGLPQTDQSAPGGPQDWRSLMDPGYEFRKREGINALSAAGAAAGNYGSGNMGVALEDFGQNLASQEFQNVYNRLAGVSGTGQVQSQAIGNMGVNTGNVMANYLNQAGQNIAQGQVAGSNALAGGVRDMEKGIASYYMFGRGGGGADIAADTGIADWAPWMWGA